MNNDFKGFTLIELLVTASIIGVIMSFGILTYQGGKARARDARRRDDLLSIQQAMEQYFVVTGAYPAVCPSAGSQFTGGGEAFLEQVPDDPDPTLDYIGTCASDYYCYSANLEIVDSGNCGGCSCVGDSCSFVSGTTMFCVKHLQ